jgi:Zn ribbon nucleic-acid-binding protein
MSQPTCVLCAYYHPRAEPHPPGGAEAQCCPAGQRRLEHDLLSLKAAFRRLDEEIAAEIGAKDRVSQALPGAPTASPSNQPRVTGSKERQLPIDVARIDLLLPAARGYVRDPYRDQAGHHSVATVLNEWIAFWHRRWFYGQPYPATDAISLIDWILEARFVHVVQHEPAIAEFAQEVREVRVQLRGALRETPPKRATMWGVPCPRCRIISQLTLDPDDPNRYRECDNCGVMLTKDEYMEHLRGIVDQHRGPMQ